MLSSQQSSKITDFKLCLKEYLSNIEEMHRRHFMPKMKSLPQISFVLSH